MDSGLGGSMGFFKSLFNPEHGLVQANLSVYYAGRVSGLGHADALSRMVRTRYPLDGRKRDKILQALSAALGSEEAEPGRQLRGVIVEMYDLEVGINDATYASFAEALDGGMDEWAAKFPGLLS